MNANTAIVTTHSLFGNTMRPRHMKFALVVTALVLLLAAQQQSLRTIPLVTRHDSGIKCAVVDAHRPSPSYSAPLRPLLVELTGRNREIQCPQQEGEESFIRVNDTILNPEELATIGGRKIPRIVHISSRSRCTIKLFADNIDIWRLKDHSLFLHDDDAVKQLLYQDWPEFPFLKNVLKCLPGTMGAAWIDVWRLLVLWEYGGIYADMDSSPVPELFNDTTITADDDAFFVQEELGCPSQWFMAASARHPLIYLTILRLMQRVLAEADLGNFQIVFTTGPGALNDGFVSFMRSYAYNYNTPAGRYVGVGNRSVTIVGNKTNPDEYITRIIPPLVVAAKKHKLYQKMNMSHLTRLPGSVYKPTKGDESCMSRLYSLEIENLTKEPPGTGG